MPRHKVKKLSSGVSTRSNVFLNISQLNITLFHHCIRCNPRLKAKLEHQLKLSISKREAANRSMVTMTSWQEDVGVAVSTSDSGFHNFSDQTLKLDTLPRSPDARLVTIFVRKRAASNSTCARTVSMISFGLEGSGITQRSMEECCPSFCQARETLSHKKRICGPR